MNINDIRYKSLFALIVSIGSTIIIASVWNAAGWTSSSEHQDYKYTEFFTNCFSSTFAIVYFALSVVLGLFLRKVFSVGFGMMLPLPLAGAFEVFLDSTTHNLLPFEIILSWLPAFIVALLGGGLGLFFTKLKPKAVRD